MKFSLSWLKQHLDTDADAQTIADTLTAIGLEVEGVDNPAEALAPFRVAKVLTNHLYHLTELPIEQLLAEREQKYRKMGVVAGAAVQA